MGEKIQKVSAFEAKTKLSELLRQTEQGTSFIICRRGKEVARLLPPAREEERDPMMILSSFQEIRARIGEGVNARELIEEGRRF